VSEVAPGELVLVHGIWMKGVELVPLASRLEACGFRCHRFRYPSVARSPRHNAAVLRRFVQSLGADRVSFVAHSLGGIVLLHLFDQWAEAPPGRAVLMGCPLEGSGVARRVAGRPWLRWTLGRSIDKGLIGNVPGVPSNRDIGMLAGTRSMGVGRLLGGLECPSDGTVALSETRHPGLADWVAFPVSHFEMLLNPAIARVVCRFLREGRFSAPGQGV